MKLNQLEERDQKVLLNNENTVEITREGYKLLYEKALEVIDMLYEASKELSHRYEDAQKQIEENTKANTHARHETSSKRK